MALHDFFCSACRTVHVDINVPIAIGAANGAPRCACGGQTRPIPSIGRMDVGAVKGAGFKKFTTRDGHNELVEIDSVSKLRRVERESEQLARNGEGQQVNFRMWSNETSNRQTHSLQPNWRPETPTADAKRKFGGARRALTEEAAEAIGTYGPGVSDQNASALPE